MGKLTFRADDDLVDRVEAMDASKSEVLREALREYLDARETPATEGTVDAAIAERVDTLVEERLRAREHEINLNISVEGRADPVESAEAGVVHEERAPAECPQCGEPVEPDHVHCPNCGEKQSRRAFCECGDEIRTDWSFCPSCGRRTPAADVLDGP